MDQILPRLTSRLLSSYQQVGGINNIEVVNVPSKRAVGAICEALLQLLFPGFYDEQPLLSSDVPTITSRRVVELATRLDVEIGKCLRTVIPGEISRELTGGIVAHFLDALPNLRLLIRTDLEAAYEGDPAARSWQDVLVDPAILKSYEDTIRGYRKMRGLEVAANQEDGLEALVAANVRGDEQCYGSYEEIVLAYPSLEAVAIQRLAHFLYVKDVPLIPRMMTEWAHSRTGIDIHPGAQLGSHFFIDHGTGVVIGETSVIGTHVKIYQGVSLGAKSFQKDDQGRLVKGGKRHPDIGDHVTIYANAVILGGDTHIGSGSTIGGNVFLMVSVPPDSLVLSEQTQPKILSKKTHAVAEGSAPDADFVWAFDI